MLIVDAYIQHLGALALVIRTLGVMRKKHLGCPEPSVLLPLGMDSPDDISLAYSAVTFGARGSEMSQWDSAGG